MELHSLLVRQLNKLSLSELSCPENIVLWHSFLERVDKSYKEADQDRILSERSQEIASKEMKSLFDRLQESQKIAQLGSWYFSKDKKLLYWSEETFKIFNRDFNLGYPSFDEAFGYVYPEDKAQCENFVKLGLEQEKEFEHDFRIVIDNQPHWVHSRGKPKFDNATGKCVGLSGTIVSIDKQKKVDEAIGRLNKQLVATARRAGMAEVATSVLHNIGNIMNSVNVSANALMDKLNNTKFSGLNEISRLIKEHQQDINKFITEDPKGKGCIEYIEKIPDFWETRKAMFLQELNEINGNIKNIKDIIGAQQVLSGSVGTYEETNVCEIIQESIKLHKDNFAKGNINFVFECSDQILFVTDRIKFLQILVNLIKNAYEAVMEDNVENKNKSIKITVVENNGANICVKVSDNGVGVRKENLEKIFSHGFTTKKGGHGFGLHSSALSAYELGGSLTVESEGEYKGCTFTLLVPQKPKRRKEDMV